MSFYLHFKTSAVTNLNTFNSVNKFIRLVSILDSLSLSFSSGLKELA